MVAEQFHAVATLDRRPPFNYEALDLHRPDLRAVLFLLAAALSLLIVVELALDAGSAAVEEIDSRPEQVLEVGLEASVAQCGDEGVEDVGEGACTGLRERQWPRIGFVLARPIAIKLKLGEDAMHDLREIRVRTSENQHYRGSGLNLAVPAIILWNTIYLRRAVDEPRSCGETIPDELLAHVAALGWKHIAFNGDYVWPTDPLGHAFRPLRNPGATLLETV